MDDTIPKTAIQDFERGSHELHDRLTGPLENIDRKFHASWLIQTQLKTIHMSKSGRFLQEMVESTDLIKPGPKDSPMRNITEFLDAVERLGTPDAKAFIEDMRRQRTVMQKSATKRFTKASARTALRRRAETVLPDDPEHFFKTYFPVYRKILCDERIFSTNAKERFLPMIDIYERSFRTMEDFRIRINAQSERAEKVYNLWELLQKIGRSYDTWQISLDKLAEAKYSYELVANEKIPDDEEKIFQFNYGASKSESRQQRHKELEALLGKTKLDLSDHERILKEHFMIDNNLIEPIAAILNNIQILCGDLVKMEIREISSWEIGVAKQQWNNVKDRIPRGNPVSAIDPATLINAMDFFEEHQDFLAAYNSAKRSRKDMANIEHEISTIANQIANEQAAPVIDLKAIREEKEHRKTKLLKAIEEIRNKTDGIQKMIFNDLDSIRKNANINKTLETIRPPEFWAEVEKSICGNTLEEVSKELDNIDIDAQARIDDENK
jgi:hypothetical protein